MTFEEKMAAIDRYFDNISSDEFNRILEEKYGIPRISDVEEGAVASNGACDFNVCKYPSGQKWNVPSINVNQRNVPEYTENDFLFEGAA